MSTDSRALAPTSSETAADSLPTRSDPGRSGVDVPEAAPPSCPPSNPPRGIKRRPTRVKAPKDSKVYKVVLAVIALRAQGVKAKAIAETLGYSEDTLRQYVSKAYKKGWINIGSFHEVDDQLEYILKHKVVRNVNEFLDDRDKDVTLEAAKGLGMFKQAVKSEGAAVAPLGMALQVNVTVPPEAKTQTKIAVRAGTIGGAAGTDIPIDAEVVDGSSEGE